MSNDEAYMSEISRLEGERDVYRDKAKLYEAWLERAFCALCGTEDAMRNTGMVQHDFANRFPPLMAERYREFRQRTK